MSNATKPGANKPSIFRNWLSWSGIVIAVGSLFAFLLLLAIDIFAHRSNPYMGILTYVVAPGFFILGFILTFLGAWIHRRQRLKSAEGAAVGLAWTIDLSRARDRKMLVVFLCGSIFFLLLTAVGSYRTYHYTESVNFCGEACHTPMKPEFVTYLHSPHARVSCSECHVGPGATWYIKTKLNGVRQLYKTITDSYSHPIKTPLKALRPAQETCERCHWPNRFEGNLDKTFNHFLADEENTPFSVRMVLKVGGGDPQRGNVNGIHWHMILANKVQYIATDKNLQKIPWVRITSEETGKATEYRTEDFKGDPKDYQIQTMDCMDCHNRPSHQFQTPDDAVDLALSIGRVDRTIPWVKSNLVSVLVQTYKSEDEAMAKIAKTLQEKYPDEPRVKNVIEEAQNIYRLNFFPEMNADWRQYPSNIGHKNWAGCFRCHDGLHKTADGEREIAATDCNACHLILAQGSGDDLETLDAKGLDFLHVDSTYLDFSCAECHTGSLVE